MNWTLEEGNLLGMRIRLGMAEQRESDGGKDGWQWNSALIFRFRNCRFDCIFRGG